MRRFILITNGCLLALWLIITISAVLTAHQFDPAGMHGTMAFFAVPSMAIGLWGRWLPLGIGLTSIALFMTLTLLVAFYITS